MEMLGAGVWSMTARVVAVAQELRAVPGQGQQEAQVARVLHGLMARRARVAEEDREIPCKAQVDQAVGALRPVQAWLASLVPQIPAAVVVGTLAAHWVEQAVPASS